MCNSILRRRRGLKGRQLVKIFRHDPLGEDLDEAIDGVGAGH
jgi:hypothetical protein